MTESLEKLLAREGLIIASHNAGKVREIGELLAPLGIQAQASGNLGVPEPEETGDSFTANAELKSRFTCDYTKKPSLSDDSGLVIPALDGAPGIYSARWAIAEGGGSAKDFPAAFRRIERELAARSIVPHHVPAYFVCVLSLCLPDGRVFNREGRVHGRLTFPPRGEQGFGYDPIFTPEGYALTFGEMEPAEKHRISHRADAFRQFLELLLTES
jgi:XTP/dITP diphosphohydrolase